MEILTIGIGLAKTVFHLVGLNARGDVVVQRKCSRNQLLRFTSNLRVCLIGMEACGGAHFLGRALRDQGHDVRLMLCADHFRHPHSSLGKRRRTIHDG
jgi:transposase